MLTKEQLEIRRNYVCGSDAATIVGKSKYKTRLELWQEKTRRSTPEDISDLPHIKFGNYAEDVVSTWFQHESGIQVKNTNEMLIHPTIPYLAGNPDRIVCGENSILECKTSRTDSEWGDDKNIMPQEYLLQVAHYCAVGSFDKAYVAVLFRLSLEMRIYTYERNQKLEDKLIAREKEFWEQYVLADVAPQPENEEDILALYSEAVPEPIVATSAIENAIQQYSQITMEIKDLEKIKEDSRKEIVLYMKNHDSLVDSSGNRLATWKYTKNINRFDAKLFEQENDELYKKYVKEQHGYRRFLTRGVRGVINE